MDATDKLAHKLIEAFEELGEEIALEQLAVPEDLSDPRGSVDLWVVNTVGYEQEEQFVVRGRVSVPTTIVLEREACELCLLFKREILHSEEFRTATLSAKVASQAAERSGVPSSEEAERN